jgi:DNA-binding MarR family transcriptional regulator
MGKSNLTELQLRVLGLVSVNGGIQRLSKEAGIAPATIGMEIARLQLEGYISEEGKLTEKGVKAVQDKT